MDRQRCRPLPSESGQELVEFALLLPLLLLLLLGIIEFGIAVFAYNTTANVGREVARYGVVHPNQTLIDAYIDNSPEIQRWTQGIVTPSLSIIYTLSGGDVLSSTIQVTATYTHTFLTGPVITAVGGDPELPLRTVTTMYTERPEY